MGGVHDRQRPVGEKQEGVSLVRNWHTFPNVLGSLEVLRDLR